MDMFLGDQLYARNIILWGTGEESKKFMQQWVIYDLFCKNVLHCSLPKIMHVWDRDPDKQRKLYHGHVIEKPLSCSWSKNEYCIIAIEKYTAIARLLEDAGRKAGRDFAPWRSFLKKIIHNILDEFDGFIKFISENGLLDTNDINLIKASRCTDGLGWMNKIYSAVKWNSMPESSASALLCVLMAYVIRQWDISSDKADMLQKIKMSFSIENIISGMILYYGRDVGKLSEFFLEHSFPSSFTKPIHTIGIHAIRYHNGGAEKFLSLIMPVYLQLGYRIVFFTDECREHGEYPLPDGVVRVVMEHPYGHFACQRMEEYKRYITQYHIDLMCYHGLYFPSSDQFLYEMLYFKLHGIPVLAEIHLMFLVLIDPKFYFAKNIPNILRLADHLIVLSRCNQIFWENLGCRTTYIPNPVERGSYFWNRPIAFKRKKGNTVLWIGRVMHTVKRVLDVVDIAEEARKSCPDIKIKIVGAPDGMELEQLERRIREHSLENAIEICGYFTDVDPLYENADVMLMTSEMECFPLVLMESKLHGVPTVMYELPYLELARDARGIISVPQGDTKSAAKAIVCLLSDDDLRHKMSIEAKRSIHPFIVYDTANAWRKIFSDIGKSVPSIGTSKEQRMVEELLLEQIWKYSDVD